MNKGRLRPQLLKQKLPHLPSKNSLQLLIIQVVLVGHFALEVREEETLLVKRERALLRPHVADGYRLGVGDLEIAQLLVCDWLVEEGVGPLVCRPGPRFGEIDFARCDGKVECCEGHSSG